MENNITLTDDELSLIMTSLHATIMGAERYLSTNGENSLDYMSMKVYKDIKNLYSRLDGEYF